MKSSPWGKVQHSEKITTGVTFVSTAGHGGYMVSQGKAKKLFTFNSPAFSKVIVWGGYLCFEEDCDASMVDYALLQDPVLKNKVKVSEKCVIESLSLWNPEFLLHVGRAPIDELYQRYLVRTQDEKMRMEKHPDLIISATQLNDGVTRVYTADNEEHLIDAESYKNVRNSNGLPLLSKCLPVKEQYLSGNA